MNDKARENQEWVARKIEERGWAREVRIAAVKRLPAGVLNQVFNDIMRNEGFDV